MPSKPGGWIIEGDGPQQLLLKETSQGLGVPKEWNLPHSLYSAKLLTNTMSVYHEEYLNQCFLLRMDTAGSVSIFSSPEVQPLPPPFQ